MNIRIASDSHDRAPLLAVAVAEAKAAGAAVVVRCVGLGAPATWILGDLAAWRSDIRRHG